MAAESSPVPLGFCALNPGVHDDPLAPLRHMAPNPVGWTHSIDPANPFMVGMETLANRSLSGAVEPGLDRAIDVDAALEKLHAIAEPGFTGRCARHVRIALEAGGADMTNRPVYAKDYGPKLIEIGFRRIPAQDLAAERGDVVVFQDYPGQRVPAGHIQMFDGTHWVSDTVQARFLANQQRYRDIPYDVFRP